MSWLLSFYLHFKCISKKPLVFYFEICECITFRYIMEWVLRSPQIHNTFSNLGFAHGDGYHINENCNGME